MQMRVLIKNLDELMRDMIPMIDRDTNAFNAYMDAMKLPKKTPEEIERRESAMQEGLKTAVQVPLQGMRTACKAWPFMTEMAKMTATGVLPSQKPKRMQAMPRATTGMKAAVRQLYLASSLLMTVALRVCTMNRNMVQKPVTVAESPRPPVM